MALTFGSLFAGIGGFDLGLERAGMTCAWQVEIDDYANRVLGKHWPDVPRWRDIKTFPPDAENDGCSGGQDADDNSNGKCGQDESGRDDSVRGELGRSGSCWAVDLICGGFPCQDISYAGLGAGLAGERSGLFYEAIRVVRILRPRWVLLENVAALLSRGMGDVVASLASIGYVGQWHCIPAAAVGAPHIRDRVFVIGSTDTNSPGLAQRQGQDARGTRSICGTKPGRSEWWATEPDVGRVAHGVPARVDRLRGLGNAVVPQVAEYIGCAIMKHHQETLIDQAASAAQH